MIIKQMEPAIEALSGLSPKRQAELADRILSLAGDDPVNLTPEEHAAIEAGRADATAARFGAGNPLIRALRGSNALKEAVNCTPQVVRFLNNGLCYRVDLANSLRGFVGGGVHASDTALHTFRAGRCFLDVARNLGRGGALLLDCSSNRRGAHGHFAHDL